MPLVDGASATLPVAAAAAIRLLLAGVAVLTTYTIGVANKPLWLRDPVHAEALRGTLKRLFDPWAHWDGVWFVRIAADGYRAHPSSEAFFPLYPLVLRTLEPLTAHNYVIAGVVASVTCYAAAMAVLYRLTNDEFGAPVASWTVVFISVFPMALFFQAVYSESLFLLLTVSSFAAARRGRWALAGVAGLLAALTRNTGLLLLMPLLVMWWGQRGGRVPRLPGGPRLAPPLPARRPSRRSLAWLLLVPSGLVLYSGYLWRQFHRPFEFSQAQSAWGRSLAWPTTSVWRGFVLAAKTVYWLVESAAHAALGWPTVASAPHLWLADLPEFLAVVFGVWLLTVCWRRLPAAYTIYALAACLFPLFFPEASEPLASYPRFLLVNFPLFIALALHLYASRRWRWVVVGAMAALSVIATVIFASFN